MLGTGIWADLVASRDGVATVALIVSGTVSFLLGVIGRMPSRLTGKDYSLEWAASVDEAAGQKTQSVVSEVISELPTDVQKELSRSGSIVRLDSLPLASSSSRSIDVGAMAEREYRFHERVAELLVGLADDLGEDISIGDGFGMDAVVNACGARVGVESKSQQLPEDTQLHVMQARIGGRERWLDAILLVSPQSVAAHVPCAHYAYFWPLPPSVSVLKEAITAIGEQVRGCDGSLSGP